MSRPKLHKPSLCLFTILIFLGRAPMAANADELLVSAVDSLTDALKEIGVAFQSKNKNKVTFPFGLSSTLARQIEEGAPADIFFSSELLHIDSLEKNGRLEVG